MRRKLRKIKRKIWFSSKIIMLIMAVIGYIWLVRSNNDIGNNIANNIYKYSASLGLKIDDIKIDGNKLLSKDKYITLLENKILADDYENIIGYPIFATSIEDYRKAVESIGWVKKSSVKRILPNKLEISIEEKQPLAIWVHKASMKLIDENGDVISADFGKKFFKLPMLVGDDANKSALELLSLIKEFSDIAYNVASITRVSNRRWDVHLKNGMRIMLPEKNYKQAWLKLVTKHRSQNVLSRNISILDLRIDGRAYLTLVE